MNENINIGNATIGNAILGGQGGTISGNSVVNAHGGQLASLQTGLEELVKAVRSSDVSPGVRDAAESARKEAAKPAPDRLRLRTLVERVRRGAEGIAAVTQAAVNVLGIIKGVH